MSNGIQEQIAAVGYAKVLVQIAPGATGDIEADLRSSFSAPTAPMQAQFASLTMAAAEMGGRRPPPPKQRVLPRMRVYRRLGIAVGIVDAEAARQLNEDQRVERVALAPEPSLIRPVAAADARAPNDTTWGIRRLRVPELWAAGITG